MLLRLTQQAEGADRHRVEIALEGDRLARQTAEARFTFRLTPQDEEDLRWYLEDYLQWPQEPAPKIAARVEGRMAELGSELFTAIFQGNEQARRLWYRVADDPSVVRVEVVTDVEEAASIPWELLRDPTTDTSLAVSVHSFVCAQPNPARAPRLPAQERKRIRILLVICRPRGGRDVPFRSVASQLIKGLEEVNREAYDLDVLRPPTFEQLGKALRQAKEEGRPYHVVHFDGHGTYAEAQDKGGVVSFLHDRSPVMLSERRSGKHGYLLFENPELDENMDLVSGPVLGKLLAETAVPVLVLNACRSAHAEPREQPESIGAASDAGDDDPHQKVRALGSLAQEVMDAGVTGVLAMRYNLYVVTAAQLIAELYASLARGRQLGEAVTLARKNLADDPLRTVAFDPITLQDWSVPVIYEAAPIALFPRREERVGAMIHIEAGATTTALGGLDPSLPPKPDVGFFGRDETLLALDRAFDRDSVVLLHAYAGSGKTTTAAEFARWYALTGGVGGAVLFSSFEHYLPLPRLLDRMGQVFGQTLEQSGVHWLALDDAQRRQIALEVLKQVPVLWIWDNVEPVAGFPAGAESAWTASEQRELVDFLRAARETKAKFLLTSRREERGWLGDLPTRVQVPPMPMTERLQLARALAEKQGRRLTDVEDWRPLLAFTQGNPLTITVLVGQALRDALFSRTDIEQFVARLRTGEATFTDEASEGRSRSLGASLAYGFEHAFTDEERSRLALLHLFQGFVDVDALVWMGRPETDWSLPEVRGLTREDWISLLDRLAEVGLLTSQGGGYYTIHPALPWFFTSLSDQAYPNGSLAATRAFVEAVGALASYYHAQKERGNSNAIGALIAEELNILEVRRLARLHGWWQNVLSAMQGLRQLYDYTGRRTEWKRLVEEIVPEFIGRDDEPLLDRESWRLVMEYRVYLAHQERRWADAERLQLVMVEEDRRQVTSALSHDSTEIDSRQGQIIRSLATSLHLLGELRREVGRADCVPAYEESLALTERIGDRSGMAACAFNLGTAYKDLPGLRNLDSAEAWYLRGLQWVEERDQLGRAKFTYQLGALALARFEDARAAGKGDGEMIAQLTAAAGLYHQALDLLPPGAVGDLAVVHHQLGIIYGTGMDTNSALFHYRQAIHFEEIQGNLYGAAQSRFNVALDLFRSNRAQDALEFASAALRDFEGFGDRAADEAKRVRRLIDLIRAKT